MYFIFFFIFINIHTALPDQPVDKEDFVSKNIQEYIKISQNILKKNNNFNIKYLYIVIIIIMILYIIISIIFTIKVYYINKHVDEDIEKQTLIENHTLIKKMD
jgi:hypothetical protein